MKTLASINAPGAYGFPLTIAIEKGTKHFYGVIDAFRWTDNEGGSSRSRYPLSQAQASDIMGMMGKVGEEPKTGDWADYISPSDVADAIRYAASTEL